MMCVEEVGATCVTSTQFQFLYMHIRTVACPTLIDPNNGVMTCSLGDDGIPSYEDTCSFTCNTGYKLFGGNSWTCQSDGSWNGYKIICRRGDQCTVYVYFAIVQ